MLNDIPIELRELNQWVCASKSSKAPMRTWERKGARISCPDDWDCFDNAVKSVELGNYDNVGFVMNDNGYVIIDIDDCFTDGGMTELAEEVASMLDSYTEISRSGTGLHIVVKGDIPFEGRNNHLKGIEIYKSKRYIIMTGNMFYLNRDIEERQEEINKILDKFFSDEDCRIRECGTGTGNCIYMHKYTRDKLFSKTYPIINEGGRNNCLTSYAGYLKMLGYSKGDILTRLLYVNQVACKPMLPVREINLIVNSVTKYAKQYCISNS